MRGSCEVAFSPQGGIAASWFETRGGAALLTMETFARVANFPGKCNFAETGRAGLPGGGGNPLVAGHFWGRRTYVAASMRLRLRLKAIQASR